MRALAAAFVVLLLAATPGARALCVWMCAQDEAAADLHHDCARPASGAAALADPDCCRDTAPSLHAAIVESSAPRIAPHGAVVVAELADWNPSSSAGSRASAGAAPRLIPPLARINPLRI